MKNRLALLAFVILVLAIASFTFFKDKADSLDNQERPQVGFIAPAFVLKGLDNKRYSLEDIKGKPVVVNFWGSWCTPCRVESRILMNFYKKYQGQVEIFAVNLTANDSLRGIHSFVTKYGFKVPILLDEEGTVAKQYQIQAIPTTFFIDEDGMIVDQVMGVTHPNVFENKLQKLISED